MTRVKLYLCLSRCMRPAELAGWLALWAPLAHTCRVVCAAADPRCGSQLAAPPLFSMLRFLFMAILAFMAPAMAFVAHAPLAPAVAARAPAATMGPAKDGPFTPIVLAAKVVLGEQQLLKVRGKAISYHSQYINEFCAECER